MPKKEKASGLSGFCLLLSHLEFMVFG